MATDPEFEKLIDELENEDGNPTPEEKAAIEEEEAKKEEKPKAEEPKVEKPKAEKPKKEVVKSDEPEFPHVQIMAEEGLKKKENVSNQ